MDGSSDLQKSNLTNLQLLRQGQLFGEISLIYDCLTTASVVAYKYSTIGRLDKKDFEEIVHEHPLILQYVKEGIFEYKDKDMRFIKMALKQLPFFEHLVNTDTIFYDIIYNLDTNKKNQGELLISKDEEIDQIYIVEKGIIEVYVIVGGKEVILERLFRGSIINFKNIFRKTKSQVNMRFAVESVVKSLSKPNIEKIRKMDKIIDRAI